MSDAVKEQLSALQDGELGEGELELLLKRVGRDAELRAAARRYAAISEAVKGDVPALASAGFADRVMAALDEAPGQDASKFNRFKVSPRLAQRLRTAGGVAIAAGVAAVAVLSVQRAEMTPALVAETSSPPAPAQTLMVVDAEPSYVVPSTTSRSAFVPATRLTNYVVAHSEYSSPLGRRSVLSGVLSEDDHVPPPAPEDASIDGGSATPQP